ncbi:class I SAM-dependent rRNA methyltransferase [Desulfuromonas sp. AOP6]|uniref:class I SAM-dependent rRNA methyltransferase n=1 Tax=Desulfuromonas sp. AOP6 TaxID=1566351 RepID=UPI0012805CED|nr:class I SAM-dependent rRNA methyltransferase [Desulfuromonas sp. AOP6]BCA80507.1 rRNA (guanine-N2)-methyltransferase [Desulfuromonas sp. AOP6]
MPSSLHPLLAELARMPGKTVKLQASNSAMASLHRGYPWLYAERVKAESHRGQPGDLGVVYDGKGRFVAVGLYDPLSPIRLRVLRASKPGPIDRAFFADRLAAALVRRLPLQGTQTDGYRLVHGESDKMPGMVIDRYGATAVVKIYTHAWIPYLHDCLASLLEQQPLDRLVLRLSRGLQEHPAYLHGLRDGQILYGDPLSGMLTCLENGLRFEVDPIHGQKTGFFLDQRDNRARVEQLARGKRVLNAFSYNGGFSLAAARGGAVEVTSLDQSGQALESSKRNFALNAQVPAIAAARHLTIQDDAFRAMAELVKQGQKYDMVIIDPPAFAVRRSQVKEALNAYGRLAHLGVSLLVTGGNIVLASCSNPVSPEDFREAVCAAAIRAGRPLQGIMESGHALDHPLDFPDSRYLKCLFATA